MTDWVPLIVAAVGVGGTLTSPVLSQWASLRGKEQEAGIRRVERADERVELAGREDLERRRAIYTELHAKARRYRSALQDYGAATAGGHAPGPPPEEVDAARAEIDVARREFAECNSRAQMIVSDDVLAKAEQANHAFGLTYRMLTRPGPDRFDGIDDDFVPGRAMQQALADLLRAMRVDLGIAAPGNDAGPGV